MGKDRPKIFERFFKESFEEVQEAFIMRLQDQQSFFKGSKNICDFVLYCFPNIFFFECKSIKGDRFDFNLLGKPEEEKSQISQLLNARRFFGIKAGVVVWFVDHKEVYYLDINKIHRILYKGKKSINIKDIRKVGIEYKNETKIVYPKFENPYKFLNDIKTDRL